MAKALTHVFPGNADVAKAAGLVEDIDQWFDVLNSRTKYFANKEWKCGLGLYEDQWNILNKMTRHMAGARFGGTKSLKPFQKGIIMTNISVKRLFDDLRNMPELSARTCQNLTAGLNQDYIENFFSRIRGLGGFYDHPLPSSFKTRLRILLIASKSQDIPLGNKPSIMEEDQAADADEDPVTVTVRLSSGLNIAEEVADAVEPILREEPDNTD
jgi:hypothetical protein